MVLAPDVPTVAESSAAEQTKWAKVIRDTGIRVELDG